MQFHCFNGFNCLDSFPLLGSAALVIWLTSSCATNQQNELATESQEVKSIVPENSVGAQVGAQVIESKPESITSAPPSGTHIDTADVLYHPQEGHHAPPQSRKRSIELILRSSPPGAKAAIDGKLVGITPTFWSGNFDGRAHDFTFVKAGRAMARYRFVATHSGIVHGALPPLQKNAETSAPHSNPSATLGTFTP